MVIDPVQQKYEAALASLIEEVKLDRSVLAAILCGSLSHDRVWEKSDVDLIFVTVDDKKVERSDVSLYADGVNVHASLVPRSEFRRMAEGIARNSFMHALLAKGRLLYSHDESVEALFAEMGRIGERDSRIQMLRAATSAVYPMYKARKWLITRGDPHYSALWLLYCASSLAQVEVMAAGQIADREVLPKAVSLNAALFDVIYTGLLEEPLTSERVQIALNCAEAYIAERAEALFAPVIEHLEEAGEARSTSEIEDHFEKNYGISGVTSACEYLSDQGLIGKAGVPVKLTKLSNLEVQELAFFHRGIRG